MVTLRDPQSAVNFVRLFNSQLPLKTELLATKLELMSKNPHTFFRYNPALFYSDIRGGFAKQAKLLKRKPPFIIIYGDAHLLNYGTFRGAHGETAWGLNDFDQSGFGSPEWDLERLATSALLFAEELGFDEKDRHDIVKTVGEQYFDTIADKDAQTSYLTHNEAVTDVKKLIKERSEVKREKWLLKFVEEDEGLGFHFRSTEKLIPLKPKEEEFLLQGIRTYRSDLKILCLTQKLGGGSSYGLPRFAILVANKNTKKLPLILEIKALLPVSIDSPLSALSRANPEIIIKNMRAMGYGQNDLTGTALINGIECLVRELEPEKHAVEIEGMKVKELKALASQAALVLARSHGPKEYIRSWMGNDQEKAIKHLLEFAKSYAEQTNADHAALEAAIKSSTLSI